MAGDTSAASVLCEPAQLKCTWTFDKNRFAWKSTGKMPDASDTTSIKHRALTPSARTPQCGHAHPTKTAKTILHPCSREPTLCAQTQCDLRAGFLTIALQTFWSCNRLCEIHIYIIYNIYIYIHIFMFILIFIFMFYILYLYLYIYSRASLACHATPGAWII